MVIKIKEILRLLRIIKLYSADGKASKNFVQRTFNDEPVKEADLPNYVEIEKICADLGMIKVDSHLIQITKLGSKVVESTVNSEINEKTKKILSECFLNGKIGKTILESLSKFNTKNGIRWYPKQEVFALFDRPEILPILYEIGFLEKKNNIVVLNKIFTPTIIEKVQKLQSAGDIRITQKQIDANLQVKKIIGNIAEKLALEYEKNRLKKDGFIKESENVTLISQEYANAGYDICSFNGKSDKLEFDRFIEVKGSIGKDIDFFWSQNEIDGARKLGDKYWIYFIPSINIEKQNSDEPILMCNPFREIFENTQYKKQIEVYHIITNNG